MPDEKAPKSMSLAEAEQVKQREGERILAPIRPDTYVVALAIDGELWTSGQLARSLDQ